MSKSIFALSAVCCLSLAGVAMGHNFTYEGTLDLDSMESVQLPEHVDVPDCTLEESKGFFQITVLNNTNTNWTDFHFELVPMLGSQVVFMVDSNVGWNPEFAVNSTPASFTYDISAGTFGADRAFNFYFDSVAPGQLATFKVWTDNTATGAPFAMLMYPTPEPASMAILGLGSMSLLARRRRVS